MIRHARHLLRALASRCLGDRAAPVGGVARDRRILRRALRGRAAGRVLVVGSGLAARQALPACRLDVVGTNPHAAEVTVCSTASGVGSLPSARWDTVIISDPGHDFVERIRAVRSACRPGARLLVLDRAGWDREAPEPRALAEVATITQVLGRQRHRLWLAEVDQ